MKEIKISLFILLLLPTIAFTQTAVPTIKIEVKPIEPTKSYSFEIRKTDNSIEIRYSRADSVRKVSLPKDDLRAIEGILAKEKGTLDSLSKDSLYNFQQRLDSIKQGNTFYTKDSTTIYKSTHKRYWDFLDIIFNAPEQVLGKEANSESTKGTYCFFYINQYQNQPDRYVFIDSLDAKRYPLLAKLVTDTQSIMNAHKVVMQRKN